MEAGLTLCMAVYVGLTLQAEVRQGRVRPGQLPLVEAVVLYTRAASRGTGACD